MEIELRGFQSGFVPARGDYLYLLAHGGRGSMKTFGGAAKLLAYILEHTGVPVTVTAPTWKMFSDNTLPPILKAFDLAGLERGSHYRYLKNDQVIEVNVKELTQVRLRTTEEPETLRGPSNGMFWMDEARESPEEAYTNLVASLRGYPDKMGLVTSTPCGKLLPSGKFHWMWQQWYGNDENIKARKTICYNPSCLPATKTVRQFNNVPAVYTAFPARTRDNPEGGAELDAQLAMVYGHGSAMYRQEALGEFVMLSGLVFETWNPKVHIKPEAQWPGVPTFFVCGVDWGYSPSPNGFLVEGADKAGRRYLLEEYKQTHMSEDDVGEKAEELLDKYPIFAFVCDSSEPRMINALKKALFVRQQIKGKSGAYVVNAQKHLKDTQHNPISGLGLCYAALNNKVEGQQAFFVHPKLKHFQGEIENYVINEKTGIPIKKNDHLIDPWRYNEEFIATHGPGRTQSKPRMLKAVFA